MSSPGTFGVKTGTDDVTSSKPGIDESWNKLKNHWKLLHMLGIKVNVFHWLISVLLKDNA